jgi:hypothetical protein
MTYGIAIESNLGEWCLRGHYLPDNQAPGRTVCRRCETQQQRERRGGLKIRIHLPAFVGDDPLPCVDDPELFFPQPHDFATLRAAEAICATCPARVACLEWALTLPAISDYGVLGGTSAIERKRIRHDRKAAS